MAQEEVGFSNTGASKNKDGGCSARLRRFGQSICNTEKGEFCGRSASSWAKIGIFYIIFYSCLAGFFAVMLVGFFATLSEKEPTQTKMYSLIKGNPGMGFRPLPNIDSTLIQFNSSDPDSYKKNIESIESVLEEYSKTNNGTSIDCSTGAVPTGDQVCEFNTGDLGPCTKENSYGYKEGQPCVLLKINRVYDWTPIPFGNTSDDTDEEATKKHEEAKSALKDRMSPDHIGVSCEGENEADIDNIGPVKFHPDSGFPVIYYPYKNQPGYRSPLVFAQFTKLEPRVLIQVWCKLWASNIKHHKNDKAGSTHFEILYSDK